MSWLAPDQDASWSPSFGGALGTTSWDKALRSAQDSLERLGLSIGLGTTGVTQDELEEEAGDRDVWASLLTATATP